MLKMKNKKPKRRYTRLIDLILNIILCMICVFTIYKAFRLDMLPGNWLLIISAALIVIFMIFFVMMFMNMPKWGLIIKRGCLILLCGVIGFAGYSLHNVSSAVSEVALKEMSSTIEIYMLVQKDSDIKAVDELSARSVGVQVGTDHESTAYGKEQLEQKLSQYPIYDEELDYTAITKLFMDHMIDGMMISSDYLTMMETNVEGLKDSYTVLDTYTRERPVNISDQKDITKESFTLLISGVDETGAADMSSLSDVNILLFVNPQANHITMLSLPRDSLMPRYSLNNMNDKLTHTGWGGIDDTMNTIEHFFGIDIDYYAKVSFTSLIEIIDAIDGIDVDVEIAFEEQDEKRSFAEDDLIKLEAGMQHLNGKQALAYARHRKTENYDVAGRERAQERIIKAIIDKLLTPEGIALYVNRLMETVPKYVVTNMPGKQITSFIKGELKDLKPWSIQSLTVENGMFDRRLVPNLKDPSSCYLWNQYDFSHVLDAYHASKENLNFKDFNFNFTEYMKYLPEYSTDTNIVWDFMAVDPY